MVFIKPTKPAREVLKRSETLKKKRVIGRFVLVSAFVALLLAIMFFLFYCRALTIRKVSVQGNSIVSTGEITSYVDHSLDGSYWLVFPYRSIFLYPQTALELGLLRQFPRLSTAEISMDGWDSLIVNVKERNFSVVWCGNSGTTTAVILGGSVDDRCYFADDRGLIFAPAPYFSDSVFTELFGFLPADPVGQTPLPDKDYATIVQVAKYLPGIFAQNPEDKYRLDKIEILDKDNYAAVITAPVAPSSTEVTSWKILFNNEYGANEIAGNFLSVLYSSPFRKDFLDNHGRLDYIDLRYDQKVYYKFK